MLDKLRSVIIAVFIHALDMIWEQQCRVTHTNNPWHDHKKMDSNSQKHQTNTGDSDIHTHARVFIILAKQLLRSIFRAVGWRHIRNNYDLAPVSNHLSRIVWNASAPSWNVSKLLTCCDLFDIRFVSNGMPSAQLPVAIVAHREAKSLVFAELLDRTSKTSHVSPNSFHSFDYQWSVSLYQTRA